MLHLVIQPSPPPELGKKSQASNARAQYTSDVAETKEFIMKEKFMAFPQDHQLPSKDELRGKVYCKYHNSWNHSINSSWSFKILIQDIINKGILKFLDKKEAMAIDENPSLPVASINTTSVTPPHPRLGG